MNAKTHTLISLYCLLVVASGARAKSPGEAVLSGHLSAAETSDRQLQKEVVVSASIDDVWQAWTTREGVTSFGPPEARIELRVGGPYEWYFIPDAPEGSRGGDGCRVLSYIPQRMLSFSWNAPPSLPSLREAGARTHVVLEFEPVDDKQVKVTLTQVGFGVGEDWTKYYDYFDHAWGYVLKNFQRRFSPQKAGASEASIEGTPKPSPSVPPTPPAAAARPNDGTSHWIYSIRPARAGFFDKMTDREMEKITAHKSYLDRLFEEGVVVFGGRGIDPALYPDEIESGLALDAPAMGIVVFTAKSAAEAKKIMQGDPAVEAGVFKACLHPFGLAFSR